MSTKTKNFGWDKPAMSDTPGVTIPQIANNLEAIDAALTNVNSSLAEIMNVKVYVESFPKLSGETDDTARIQRAINQANSLLQSSNTVGGSLYYQTRASVVFNPQTYTTSATITIPEGVDLISEGQTIFMANPSNNTVNAFSGTKVNRMRIEHLTFVGYATALTLQTSNIDASLIKLIDVVFHKCSIGLDTVGINNSVSTIVHLERCISWSTDIFAINYCDKMILENCWSTHSGYSGANIINHNNLVIQGGIFVPQVQTGADPRWIDFYTDSNNQQGVFVENARFGGEGGGGIPIVFNHAHYNNNYATNMGKIISFRNCQLASAAGRNATVVLYDTPNRISIKDCFGLFNMQNGIVVCDSSYDPTTIPVTDLDYIFFDFDSSACQGYSFPKVQSNLSRFLSENKLMPPSSKPQQYTKLQPQAFTLASGASQISHKLGITNQYTNGLLTMFVTAGRQGSMDVIKKRIDITLSNGNSSLNQVSSVGTPVITTLANIGTADFTISATINATSHFLEITLSPNSGTSNINFYVEGEVYLTYIPGGIKGRLVWEN